MFCNTLRKWILWEEEGRKTTDRKERCEKGMEDKYRKDLTEGNVNKQLIQFAMPFLVAQILQALYSIADMLIVGRFMGDYGISAVNVSSIMTNLITFVVSGFSLSGTVLVAQYVGAKREEDAKKTIGTIFTLFIVLSIIITVLGLALSDFLLDILNTPAESRIEAANYLIICFSGTIFISGYNAVSAVLRGLGDSKRPLMFVALAAITNVVLDIIFVGPLGLGAGGAALATVISQGLSFVLAVITLYRQNFLFDFKLKSFRIDRQKLPLVFKIGLPSAVQSTIVNFSYIFVVSNINAYGLAASTAAGICSKIDSFAVLPTAAISQAVASMAGQNLGAKKYDRARGTMFAGLRMSIVFGVIVFLAVRIFARPLISMFGCGPEAMEIGIMYIQRVSFIYLFNSVTFVLNGLATGSGYSIFSMFNSIMTMVISRVALIMVLTRVFDMGLQGIFTAMGLCPVVGIVLGTCFYLSGKWKTSVVSKMVTEDIYS